MPYMLFAGQDFYPGGGWNDFRGTFDTIREAVSAYITLLESETLHWGHVVGTKTMSVEWHSKMPIPK